MKRRTLDILFSGGGLALAALIFVLGVVLTSNANFAKTYVTDQLSQQKVTFKEAKDLTAEEKQAPCVVANAGKALTTGKQAECYANSFIALHLKTIGGGKTYAELGDPQTALRTQVADAQKANDPNLSSLQKQLADITASRETVFKGETLRGLLLTSYGFSQFGDKASQAATVAFAGAALLALLAMAGFVHALTTPPTVAFAPTEEPVSEKRRPREMTRV